MINRVVLMGRLVADPELKTTQSGVSVTSFRIAVDRSYVKAGAERQADFFDVVAWRSSAEFVCRNFSKGSLIAVDGQLQSRQYQTKDGQNRTAIEVVADNISFTGERKDAAPPRSDEPIVSQPTHRANPDSTGYYQQPYARQQSLSETQYQNDQELAPMPLDDDLPF